MELGRDRQVDRPVVCSTGGRQTLIVSYVRSQLSPAASICVLLGVGIVVLVGALLSSWKENSNLTSAYGAARDSAASLRQELQAATDRETAANEKSLSLQAEVNTDNDRLQQMQSVIAQLRSNENPEFRQADSSQAPTPASDQSQSNTITDNSGHTYTVSDADYNRLLPIKQELDRESQALDIRKTALDAKSQAHQNSRIDDTDQAAVDSYNLEADAINTERTSYNEAVDIFNSKVDDFNTELHRVGTLKQ